MSGTFITIAQTASDSVGIVGGSDARAIIFGLLTGIAFGAILQRVGASSYALIVNMLRLKDLTIMKFFFLAVAVGSLGIYVTESFGTVHIGIAPLYLVGITVGGLIFGVGWAVSGYCPGTSLVAMGEGKTDAAITVFGGLVGALALALTWDWIEPNLVQPLNYGPKSLPEVLGVKPLLVAVVLTAIIVAFVMYLDHLSAGPKAAEGSETPGAVT
ncbi:MAG: YeeE/YedE thiosulfate transporter family protein [Thermoleophilia bacterium]|nr:YeeE/YedE thiosulfate transporter family protein [Thermoleophilia bacterium]